MGVREKINSARTMGFVVAGVLLVVAASQIAFFFHPHRRLSTDETYYTDDDGQTYFKDSIYKFPPFDHDGKQANMAVLYSSDSFGKFVAYQVRFKPAAQKELQDLYDKAQKGDCPLMDVNGLMTNPRIGVAGEEVKMRGSDKWIPLARMPHDFVHAPDGSVSIVVRP
jgi:hypothetical protein